MSRRVAVRGRGTPLVLVLLGLMVAPVAAPAWSQESLPPKLLPDAGGERAGPSDSRAAPRQTVTHDSCVEVEIGGDRAFDCLNLRLKRQVEQVHPLMNIAPVDAQSPDIRVGVFNQPAVQQQYGSNFGRSIVPFRPPPSVFGPSLGRR